MIFDICKIRQILYDICAYFTAIILVITNENNVKYKFEVFDVSYPIILDWRRQMILF